MPNFNGAIVMHTLKELQGPATLREVVATIAKHTELPIEELMKPVKQTLEAGYRTGYLQRVNGRYFVVPMSFETLRAEVLSLARNNIVPDFGDKARPKAKRTIKEPQVQQQQPQQLQLHRRILRQHLQQQQQQQQQRQQQQDLLRQECSYTPVGSFSGQDSASTTTLMPLHPLHLQRKPKRFEFPMK